MELNKNVILILLLVVVLFWALSSNFEFFAEKPDYDVNGLIPIGYPKTGLRGEPLHWSSIDKLYIRPDRQIRLSQTGAMMWDANRSPIEQGIPDCYKVDCPTCMGGYDKTDSCYKCGNNQPEKMVIPDIAPHVPN